MMRRHRLFLVLLLAATILLAWLLATRVLAPPLVRTTAPVRGPLTAGVYATGVVEPVEWAKVRAETAGRIVALQRAEGDEVVPGDLLAQIEDQKQRARLAEIEARMRYLDAERERQRALVGGG
ncbi:biotin/lipoyl-binding protein, partial [Stella sp.]|uniref:biotin/lipoyl-binding protein n=1 Tax=Stella sp. TaxID=2912054 RepID=UPI0035B1E8F1